MDRKKLEDYEISLKEKDKARKKFVTIMDNQALEIKRIKTTQINFDRKKKKGTRLAGNKTAWNNINNAILVVFVRYMFNHIVTLILIIFVLVVCFFHQSLAVFPYYWV